MQNVFCTRWNNNYDVSISNYRRAKFCGGYYFFTVVSYKRGGKLKVSDIFLGLPLGRSCRPSKVECDESHQFWKNRYMPDYKQWSCNQNAKCKITLVVMLSKAKHLGLEREKRFFTALRYVQNDRVIVVQSTTYETEGFSPIPRRIGH